MNIDFFRDRETINVCSGLDLSIAEGETVALVGESGSGKSVTALSLIDLLPRDLARVSYDKFIFMGKELKDHSEISRMRGSNIGFVFQEPMTSLNPVFSVGEQIAEVLRRHRGASQAEAKKSAIDMMEMVKIPNATQRYHSFPFEMSGGMRQRIMIAIALICRPQLLIADEPTTALDATVQLQILDLIQELQKELRMALLLITHDFGVVLRACKRVMVLYGGRVVESGFCSDVVTNPVHPYTRGLLNCIVRPGARGRELATIAGSVPPLGNFPSGCRFRDRCSESFDKCKSSEPLSTTVQNDGQSRQVACFAREVLK